jgi:hypothetical protein
MLRFITQCQSLCHQGNRVKMAGIRLYLLNFSAFMAIKS